MLLNIKVNKTAFSRGFFDMVFISGGTFTLCRSSKVKCKYSCQGSSHRTLTIDRPICERTIIYARARMAFEAPLTFVYAQ